MSKKAEIIKDCNRQIQIYELMLERDGTNKALQELLEKEKKLPEEVKLSN